VLLYAKIIGLLQVILVDSFGRGVINRWYEAQELSFDTSWLHFGHCRGRRHATASSRVSWRSENRMLNSSGDWLMEGVIVHSMEALQQDVCGVEMAIEGSISGVIRGFDQGKDRTDMLSRNDRPHLDFAERFYRSYV